MAPIVEAWLDRASSFCCPSNTSEKVVSACCRKRLATVARSSLMRINGYEELKSANTLKGRNEFGKLIFEEAS